MKAPVDEIVGATKAWLGTPYRHQASCLGAGCDCLGLIRGVWRSLYGQEPYQVPPYTADIRHAEEAETLQHAANRWLVAEDRTPQPGDVLLFRLNARLPARHCAILTALDSFVHAQERLGVVEAPLSHPWRQRLAAVFSFPPKG